MDMSLCPSANKTAHQLISFHLLTDAHTSQSSWDTDSSSPSSKIHTQRRSAYMSEHSQECSHNSEIRRPAKIKEPYTNPFATQYRFKCIQHQRRSICHSVSAQLPCNFKIGPPHLLKHQTSLHTSGELRMVKKGWLPFFASLPLYNV